MTDKTPKTYGTIRGRAREAMDIILRFMRDHEFSTANEGYYSGKAWRERGESWGDGCILAVTYDGGDLYTVMSGEYRYVAAEIRAEIEAAAKAEGRELPPRKPQKYLDEELREKLSEAGFMLEEMTHWCAAIYDERK